MHAFYCKYTVLCISLSLAWLSTCRSSLALLELQKLHELLKLCRVNGWQRCPDVRGSGHGSRLRRNWRDRRRRQGAGLSLAGVHCLGVILLLLRGEIFRLIGLLLVVIKLTLCGHCRCIIVFI